MILGSIFEKLMNLLRKREGLEVLKHVLYSFQIGVLD